MGIFLKSSPPLPQTEIVIAEGEELQEQAPSEVLEEGLKPTWFWGRLIFAVVLLAAIFFAGIYCAQKPELSDWNKLSVHSFELLLGAFIGILTGELAAKKG